MRDKKEIVQWIYNLILNILVVLGLIWVSLALLFDVTMIYLHFFNQEVQAQILRVLRQYL